MIRETDKVRGKIITDATGRSKATKLWGYTVFFFFWGGFHLNNGTATKVTFCCWSEVVFSKYQPPTFLLIFFHKKGCLHDCSSVKKCNYFTSPSSFVNPAIRIMDGWFLRPHIFQTHMISCTQTMRAAPRPTPDQELTPVLGNVLRSCNYCASLSWWI